MVTITQDHIFEYAGICLNCGESRDSCEPDARDYLCESCGERKVYGIAEAIMMGVPVEEDVEMEELFNML